MILIIDEVDKSSGNRVFMQFLGVLRNKYLAMSAKEDLTFKSVILGGVNDIKNIDEYLNKDWILDGIYKAIKMTLNENNTLFDDVIKNVENYDEIKTIVYEILVEGKQISYNPFAYEKGIMYGILAENEGRLVMQNKIFEGLLYEYLIAQRDIQKMASKFTQIDKSEVLDNDKLDMEKLLLKFQEFMYGEYREEDEHFYETNGRLIFLAYLKPILNGKGFSFVEPQTRQNKRMDIVITYGSEKHIVELKRWNGEAYRVKGIEQLTQYMDEQVKNKEIVVKEEKR